MKKAFVEKEEQSILLSDYLEELTKTEEKDKVILGVERSIAELNQVIKYLGDVKLPKSIICELCSQFHSVGGRYNVRSDKKTIEALYKMYLMYPKLSACGLNEIAFVYIKDLFEKYSLYKELGRFIEQYGETNEAMDAYTEYVDQKAEILEKEYIEKAKELGVYIKEYGYRYIFYLQRLIVKQHISKDRILECMPSAEIISAEEYNYYNVLPKYEGASFGIPPLTYLMTEQLAKHGDLSNFPEQPAYYFSIIDKTMPASFTKTEFLESIKKEKTK